jgi:esterase/lipase
LEEEGDKKKTISQNFLVSAETVKEAYERIVESLSTLMIDYQITQIIASPIVDIFPYNDSEVESPAARRILPEIEHEPKAAGKVFSASGSDIDDFDDDFEEETAEQNNVEEEDFEGSEISDEYTNEDED